MTRSNDSMTKDEIDELLRTADEVLAPTYVRPSILFRRGRGATLTDAAGRDYLDMTAGIAVTALGHGSPVVAGAIREAAEGLIHTSNLFHTIPAIELARLLVERSFADKVFFANSGAEAVEGAIKFARLHGGAERRKIVSFQGSFHGRTLGALAATDSPEYQEPFRPLPEGFELAPFGDERLEAIDERTAAAIIEPIQGERGVRVAGAAWLRRLRDRCREVGALLVFDEIQCGLGRTGKLWAYEHSGVEPDMMTLAKALAGGLPMGAVLLTDDVSGSVPPRSHATTFGGGPLVSSVALAVLRTVSEPAFLAEVADKGRLLRRLLSEIRSELVLEVRGEGLMAGLRLEIGPGPVVEAARDEGLLVVPAGDNVVRVLPPLTVSPEELERAAALLDRAVRRVEREVVA